MKYLNVILLLSLGSLTLASYCGQSGVPFSFESLSNGQPVLGCARPSCFGWDAHGKRAADTAQFYKIDGKSDGFLRKSDIRGPIVQNATSFRPQFSVCDRGYTWEQCVGPNQWVGGIAPLAQISADSSFRVMCCTYSKLSESADQGVAEIKAGQTVVGGEINGDDGRQHAFEYISNIRRSFNEKGEVLYTITLKRFPCIPQPDTTETGIENGTIEELIKNVEKEQKAAMQFGAPTVQSSQPVQTFDTMKFDIPNNVPTEDAQRLQLQRQPNQQLQQEQQTQQQQPLQLATAEPAAADPPSGYRRLANGQVVPCAKPYPGEEEGKLAIAIPQNSQIQQSAYSPDATYQPPQVQQQQITSFGSQPQPQNQQSSYFQPSLFDPFGLFRQAYAAPTASLAPAVAPTFSQHSPVQSIPPPNQSYNPYWPFQGYYSYSQNPSATYGVPTAQSSAQSQPLIAQGTKIAPPRPQPLPVPTVEQVENAIPPAGRRMLYNVAKTLLNL